ncbi:hypothetical protein HSX11_15410 [Oxalobacteraceae bacterium]|nr:hypothetical protein [Oxalobacteraceae bacterium]
MDDKMKPLARPFSFKQPCKTVCPVTKDDIASIAAASDVIKSTRKFESEWADHHRNLAGDHRYALTGRISYSAQPQGLVFLCSAAAAHAMSG